MSKNDGGSAFPSHGSMGEVAQEGMTLREYFAAHCPDYFCNSSEYETAIRQRWSYADAMLAERERK